MPRDRLRDPTLQVTTQDHPTYPLTFLKYLYSELHISSQEVARNSCRLEPLRQIFTADLDCSTEMEEKPTSGVKLYRIGVTSRSGFMRQVGDICHPTASDLPHFVLRCSACINLQT